jgi:signal peptidase I
MTGLVLAGVAAAAAAGLWWLRRRLLVASVTGRSMTPFLADGERVLVRRCPGWRVAAGQVVVVAMPRHRRPAEGAGADRAAAATIVKRVAAVAGDPVPAGVGSSGRLVPPGMLVVLGDNQAESADSRHFGLISDDRVVGIVVRRLNGPQAGGRRRPAGHPMPPGRAAPGPVSPRGGSRPHDGSPTPAVRTRWTR